MSTDHIPKRRSNGKPRQHPELFNRLPSDQQPMNTLVAAARRLTGTKMKRSVSESWQAEAWEMLDEVGELRFVANALASAGSKARLFAARLGTGDQDPTPLTEEEDTDAADVAARESMELLGGSALKRSELLRRLLLQLFVPGDGFLVGLPPGVVDKEPTNGAPGITPIGVEGGEDLALEELDWHTMAVEEISIRGDKLMLHFGSETVELPESQCVMIRVWRPHPRRWWQADSPVRANLPVLRELVGLTKHVGATIDSRLAGAGLLIVGSSVEVMSPASDDPDDPDAEEALPADFMDALLEAMTSALEDRDSAASIVPLAIKVPDDVVDKIRHISFSTPFDSQARELRDEAIRRLALGLDAPPEVLLGLGESNHWSAWQIDEATTKTHIEPVLALVCDALTVEYLWPVLEAAGVENPKEYVVWFDTANLIMRPNRTNEAMSLHGVGALSDEALRRESGFGEDDAPELQLTPAVEATIAIAKQSAAAVAENPQLIVTILSVLEQLYAGTSSENINISAPAAEESEPESEDEAPSSGRELPDTQDEAPETPPAQAASANGSRRIRVDRVAP